MFNEFYSTIELLRGDNGKEIACNFPARYLWIKKHIEIPNYDLKSCEELNQFMDNIQKDNLWLEVGL